jgi:hypothetical protein
MKLTPHYSRVALNTLDHDPSNPHFNKTKVFKAPTVELELSDDPISKLLEITLTPTEKKTSSGRGAFLADVTRILNKHLAQFDLDEFEYLRVELGRKGSTNKYSPFLIEEFNLILGLVAQVLPQLATSKLIDKGHTYILLKLSPIDSDIDWRPPETLPEDFYS